MSTISVIDKLTKTQKRVLKPDRAVFSPLLNMVERDPLQTLLSGRIMAKAWVKELEPDKQHQTIQHFLRCVISAYWESVHDVPSRKHPLPATALFNKAIKLDNSVLAVATVMGNAAAKLNVVNAAYELGNLYTSILPEDIRSANGVFYTPPTLTSRLIANVDAIGINWDKAKVADPASGGGAFLIPLSLRIINALKHMPASEQLDHIERHLHGYEIDPFAAWLSQVFLEVSLKEVIKEAQRRVKPLVTICNTLEHFTTKQDGKYDLVIGNPPYGKLKLTDDIRQKYKASLYGHPNLYGLFTHLAIDMVKSGGILGYLTPTSFLSGEYFKNLRLYIRQHTAPLTVDFVAVRKGVFEDVLQETMLAVYRKKASQKETTLANISVNEIETLGNGALRVTALGSYELYTGLATPWVLPRHMSQTSIVDAMLHMQERLNVWGYKISTGQLVWNRYKKQLLNKVGKNCYPIVWAEAVTKNGEFVLKAEKKNHTNWFRFKEGDDYLLTSKPCILLQRTTSKEQEKRLITTVLPQSTLNENGAVIVENHLNMIIPVVDKPKITLKLLSIFLNSKAVNDAFRTISGSVAVSAYELESLPLPPITKLKRLKSLVNKNASEDQIEIECLKLYTKSV